MIEYLITFFKRLEGLTQRRGCDVSNAITTHEGSLCVLVSMGDVRARVPVQELDPDPARAAEAVFERWTSMSQGELERSIEDVR
jgi:hypothetical protein